MLLLKLLSKLPFSVLYFLSNILAFMLFHIIRYRRSVSFKNISNAFPELDRREAKRIQAESYKHFSDTLFEIIKCYSLTTEEVCERIELEGFSEVKSILDTKRSVLFLTAHFGPTEWVAYKASLSFNAPIDPVYKPVHNKTIDKFLFAARSHCSASPIPYKTMAKDMVARKNITRCIAVLSDLEPRSRDQAIYVNFLNQNTRFYIGSERLAKLSKLPVYYISMVKTQRGYYTATTQKLCDDANLLANEELTRKYAAWVEKDIKENPSAWLWTHKRWKVRKQK